MSSSAEIRPMIATSFQGTQGALVPISAEKKQALAEELAVGITPAFERYFATLAQIAEIEQENLSLIKEEKELTQHIEELTQRNKVRQNEIKEYESLIQECESRIEERERSIEERERSIEERQKSIGERQKSIEERERHISELREQNLTLQRQRDEQVRLRDAMIQKAEENKRILAEKQALRDALKVEAAKHGAAADRLEASVAHRKENIAKLESSIATRQERIVVERQVIAKSRASTADKFKPLLCKYFSQAFFGKDAIISGAQADELYSQYLSKREVTVGKDSAGKACVQVNDPAPFTSFSQAHPEITSCNLSAFTFIETHAQTLIDYLSSKGCPLKVVTFNNRMSQALQQLFKQASLDNGSLTISFVGASSATKASSSS